MGVGRDWCILRCAGQNTLPLVRSLTKAGLEVWTPVELVTKRVPRANLKRRVECPLLPSYLFAPAPQLPDLVGISNDPASEHRDFRLFKHLDRFPLIADETLAPLRMMERKRKPADDSLKRGDRVRLTDGAYAGLSGVVEASRGQFAMVAIPGFRMTLKIAAFYLLRDETSSYKQRAA